MKPLFYTMVAVSLFSVPAIAQDRAAERAAAYREVGVTRLVFGSRYADADAFRREAEALAALRS